MCLCFLRCCGCYHRKSERKFPQKGKKLTGMAINNEHVQGKNSTEPFNNVVVARRNYKPIESICIEIDKNDSCNIIGWDNPQWKLVKNLQTSAVGYAPANILGEENSLLREEWYFGKVKRKEVETSLLRPDDEDGTFLIRKSNKNKTFPYVLSVKFSNSKRKNHVTHYPIFEDDSKQYFITKDFTFASLAELVETYKRDELLCVRLLKSCESPEPTIKAPSPPEHWEIPKNEIRISRDRKLGRGHYSTVFHGIWNSSINVAVKMIKDGDIKEILKEVDVMRALKHKNIVMLYGVSTMSKPYWIIEEYVDHGDLLSNIKQTEFSEEQNIYISYQIADGMSYLESRNIVHRDLAARNILLGNNEVVKIGDLGLSRNLNEDGNYVRTSELELPIRWMSPESFTTAQNSSKGDVWSFGILLIELYTNGDRPYHDLNNTDVVTKVQAGYRMSKPQKMPVDVYELVCKCWNADPNKRPSFEELKATYEGLYYEYVD